MIGVDEGGSWMKIVLGVVAGLVVAFLCVMGIEAVGHSLYPPPAGPTSPIPPTWSG